MIFYKERTGNRLGIVHTHNDLLYFYSMMDKGEEINGPWPGELMFMSPEAERARETPEEYHQAAMCYDWWIRLTPCQGRRCYKEYTGRRFAPEVP